MSRELVRVVLDTGSSHVLEMSFATFVAEWKQAERGEETAIYSARLWHKEGGERFIAINLLKVVYVRPHAV